MLKKVLLLCVTLRNSAVKFSYRRTRRAAEERTITIFLNAKKYKRY